MVFYKKGLALGQLVKHFFVSLDNVTGMLLNEPAAQVCACSTPHHNATPLLQLKHTPCICGQCNTFAVSLIKMMNEIATVKQN